MATSKLHVIRQVLSNLCKGPGFDTVWSKVLSCLHLIIGVNMCPLVIYFKVPRPLSLVALQKSDNAFIVIVIMSND